MKYLVSILFLLFTFVGMAQEDEKKPTIEKPAFKIVKDTVILDGKKNRDDRYNLSRYSKRNQTLRR